jgi:hypothetical protein
MSNGEKTSAGDGAPKTWLFMLYLSGDNNLSSEMIHALEHIKEQSLPEGIAMTILYDALSPSSPTYVFDLSGKRAKGPGGKNPVDDVSSIPLPLTQAVARWPEDRPRPTVYEWVEDTSNPRTLRTFIDWSKEQHKLQNQMLVLSGHGSGVVGDFLLDEDAGADEPGVLTIPDLATALNGAGITILGMDSCLMSMAEVCYEVRNHVGYVVGSEGFVLSAGWPYGHLLSRLRDRLKNRDITLEPGNMAKFIVDDYLDYYREFLPAGVSVDMAACQLAKFSSDPPKGEPPSLKTSMQELTKLLIEKLNNEKDTDIRNRLILAHWRAQSYKFEQYTDLWDFCQQLQDIGPLDKVSDASGQVQKSIEAIVGGRQDYEGIEFQHSHGLSVYFPWSTPANMEGVQTDYDRLQFAQERECNWSGFLTKYLQATRRKRRGDGEKAVRGLQIFGPDSEIARNKVNYLKELRCKRARRPYSAVTAGQHAPSLNLGNVNLVRNSPFGGKNSPFGGKMMALLGEILASSMKNPPQSVFLRPPRSGGSSTYPRERRDSLAAAGTSNDARRRSKRQRAQDSSAHQHAKGRSKRHKR